MAYLLGVILAIALVICYRITRHDQANELTAEEGGLKSKKKLYNPFYRIYKGRDREIKEKRKAWHNDVARAIVSAVIATALYVLLKHQVAAWVSILAIIVMAVLYYYLVRLAVKEAGVKEEEWQSVGIFAIAALIYLFFTSYACVRALDILPASKFSYYLVGKAWPIVAICVPLVLFVMTCLGKFNSEQDYPDSDSDDDEDDGGVPSGLVAFIVAVICFGIAFAVACSAKEVEKVTSETVTAVEEVEPEAEDLQISAEEADALVAEFIPAEVNEVEMNQFYAEFADGRLMSNTWTSYAEDKKMASGKLLDGKGLYDAVEFPLDIPLTYDGVYYTSHKGSYSDENLAQIKSWIDSKIQSGTLTDNEAHQITMWTMARIARDPVYGHMWAQAFAELHSRSGKTVREMNPVINEFLTNWENGNRLEYYSVKSQADGELYVSRSYKEVGYVLATTFSRLTVESVAQPTAEHWHMPDVSVTPDKLATVKADYTESKAAAILVAYGKGVEVFEERLAINLYDGRAEKIVEVEIPKQAEPAPQPTVSTPEKTTTEQKKTPSPSPQPTKPKEPEKPQPTPTPTPKPSTTPTPTPSPEPEKLKKDPSERPAEAGKNANDGAGTPTMDGKGGDRSTADTSSTKKSERVQSYEEYKESVEKEKEAARKTEEKAQERKQMVQEQKNQNQNQNQKQSSDEPKIDSGSFGEKADSTPAEVNTDNKPSGTATGEMTFD